MGNRTGSRMAFLLVGIVAAFLIYAMTQRKPAPMVDGSLPDRAMPDRQNKFLNLRLRKIERASEQVRLTPLHILGFDNGTKDGSDAPLLAKVGTPFRFLKASPKLTYVVQSIESDGVVVGFGDSAEKVAGTTKLAWK